VWFDTQITRGILSSDERRSVLESFRVTGARGTPRDPRRSAFPNVAERVNYYLNSRASDADALAVMAPKAGRIQNG
jgi:hypothetical protein